MQVIQTSTREKSQVKNKCLPVLCVIVVSAGQALPPLSGYLKITLSLVRTPNPKTSLHIPQCDTRQSTFFLVKINPSLQIAMNETNNSIPLQFMLIFMVATKEINLYVLIYIYIRNVSQNVCENNYGMLL